MDASIFYELYIVKNCISFYRHHKQIATSNKLKDRTI